jgi:hypothetical protein
VPGTFSTADGVAARFLQRLSGPCASEENPVPGTGTGHGILALRWAAPLLTPAREP